MAQVSKLSCAACSSSNASMRCGGCKSRYYCNVECQRTHWKQQHKKECKQLKQALCKPNDDDEKHHSQQTSTTSTKSTKSKSTSTKKAPALFRIEEIEGKGLGMVATQDIAAGTMILNEPPLLYMVNESAMDVRAMQFQQFEKEFAKPLLQRFKALSKAEQQTLNALSSKHDGSVIDVFLNNCLSNDAFNFDAVYPTIARINHSCDANALHWVQQPTSKQKQHEYSARVIARQPIRGNEEICINYLGWHPFTCDERALKLKAGWKIAQCQCRWCDVKQRAHFDAVIQEYKRLDAAIPDIQNIEEKYANCVKMVKLIREKLDGNPQLLYRHCWDLSQCAMFVMRRDEFVANLVETVKNKRLAHGKDTGIPDEVQEVLQQIGDDEIKQKIYAKLK